MALIPLGRLHSPVPLLACAGCLRPSSYQGSRHHAHHAKRPAAQAQVPRLARQRQSTTAAAASTPTSRPLDVLNPNAAGIDVHSDMHMVCVPADPLAIPAENPAEGLPANVRRFGANSCDLVAIADWLPSAWRYHLALESTGVYWIPLFELLEVARLRGLAGGTRPTVALRRLGPRPTCLTCSGSNGCIPTACCGPSFRPPDSIMALRGYHRQRQMQIRYAASHVQHMQKALEQMNVKLTEVLADITGLTGRRIIAAILDRRTRSS